MRRLLPFVLLALLGAGSALGAVLGAVDGPAQASPAQWVANVLAVTARAGSAQFSYSRVATSPNRYLASQTSGIGQIDFTHGDVRTTEADHNVQFSSSGPEGSPSQATFFTNHSESIGIGKTVYQGFSLANVPDRWNKLGVRRDPGVNLGLEWAGDADDALSPLGGDQRVIAVENLGSATLDGTPTTRYLVTSAPVCAAPKSPHPSYVDKQRPTELWLDGRGRLVQARTSDRLDSHPPSSLFPGQPGLAKRMSGRVTTTATLHFSAFGQPVHISAPSVGLVIASTGTGLIEAKCASKTHTS